MIEYAYPECTTSTITALSIFRKYYPDYRAAEIEYVPSVPSSLPVSFAYLHPLPLPTLNLFLLIIPFRPIPVPPLIPLPWLTPFPPTALQ